MLSTLGINGLQWIGGKPLMYSKPIIGDDMNCELMGWISEDFGLNGASTFPLIIDHGKGTQEPSESVCKQY